MTLFTVGSRGDIEPYIALGHGLVAVGNTVRLSTHERYEPEIREAGMEFSPAGGDPRLMMEAEPGKRWLASGRNPVRIMQRLLDLSGPIFHQYLKDCEAAMAGTDAVLFSVLAFPAYHLAEAARIPAIGAYLQPMTRTRQFPSLFMKRSGSGLLNLWSHVAVEQITWQPVRRSVNRWRAGLGLGPLPRSGLYRSIYKSMPVLYGFSPAVVTPPSDWPDQIKVTGYWVRERPRTWRPSEALTRFLADGPAPVYVGFGSRPEREPEVLTGVVLAAVRRTGKRAVLLTGWGGLKVADSSDDVLVVDDVPHDWLFPQMAAVVHHGGAGTTGTALQSGTPSVVVPSFADQFFWGERVEALGVGVSLPRRRLTIESLSRAILTTDQENIRSRSAELAARLRAENGVERAVDHVTAIVAGRPEH
ncbi:MAG: glycosyltransferase [Acidimicrobiia bacterium]|nr:glycosyltransferase [Acidimicrobiia bacterium]